jgi:hypothetical protein
MCAASEYLEGSPRAHVHVSENFSARVNTEYTRVSSRSLRLLHLILHQARLRCEDGVVPFTGASVYSLST